MNNFSLFVIRHRKVILILVALFTVWFGYKATQIQVDTDVLNFFPDDDPDVRFFKETGGKFGSNYINFVAVEADDLFSQKALTAVRKITRNVQHINGVKQVLSLTNMIDMKRDGGTLNVTPLVNSDRIPGNKKELEALRQNALSNPLLVGSLVSKDGHFALISVRIAENADKEKVAALIKETAKKQAPDFTLYFGGFSMVMEYMGKLIASDMAKLIPITFIVVLLMLFVGFGSMRGVILPMGAVLLSIVWTLGAMTMFNLPLSMLTSVIPVVIIAIGTAPGIYVLVRYYELKEEGEGEAGARLILSDVMTPVVVSGITMVIGFLSLATAPLEIFKEFGYAAGMGGFFTMAISATFIPATLSYLKYKKPKSFALASPDNRMMSGMLAGTARFVVRGRIWILAAALVAILIAIILYPRIPRNVNLLSYFPKDSEPQVSEIVLKNNFGGSQLFIVNFRGKDVRDPAILDQMDMLSKRLRVIPNVNLPQSGAELVIMLNRLLNDAPGLPDSMDKVNNLWVLLEGQASVEMLVENNNTNAVVQARIGDMDNAVVAAALKIIRTVLKDTVKTDLISVDLDSANAEQRAALYKFQANKIAEKVVLDIAFYTKAEVRPPQQVSSVLTTVISNALSLEVSDRQSLEENFRAYFTGDEVDIELEKEFSPDETCKRLSMLADFSKAAVLKVLKDSLPAKSQKNDPEAIVFVTDSILSISQRYMMDKKFNIALNAVFDKTQVKPKAIQNAMLMADLKADIWGVTHQWYSIDTKTYKKIFGKKIPDKNVIALQARLTGWPPINIKFDRQLVATQVKSVLLAIATLLIVLAIYYRSIIGGILAAIPIAFTVLMKFAAMGFFLIPLDNTTIMISSIAMGIGIGYAIHMLARLKGELAKGKEYDQALTAALTSKGRAIIINTLAVALGFSVLVFSVMTPQRRFGLLIALTMVFATLGTFTVLPALILKLRPAFLKEGSKTKSVENRSSEE